MRIKKVQNKVVDREFLKGRARHMIQFGYPIPKWMEFCQEMLAQGFHIVLTEHKKSSAKYLIVSFEGQAVQVRFASEIDHTHQQWDAECQFLVGGRKSNSNTFHAIRGVVDKLTGE